ncbi:hypothetical protein LSH36_69g01006 [Paralvinella palmiformis]|uniref:Uncharacterized protein n=1 Tax=Paralvinella palmiformis TaxID=53620 RepID=A0AAD9K376_9ANNE|nr:hypothetical protein LSH36_69g01006 [Paralvinella palmiformis]
MKMMIDVLRPLLCTRMAKGAGTGEGQGRGIGEGEGQGMGKANLCPGILGVYPMVPSIGVYCMASSYLRSSGLHIIFAVHGMY